MDVTQLVCYISHQGDATKRATRGAVFQETMLWVFLVIEMGSNNVNVLK